MGIEATRLGAHRATLGESPVWDAATARLCWLDIPGRALLATDPRNGDTQLQSLPRKANANRPIEGGGWVATAGLDLCCLDPDGSMSWLAGVDEPREGGFNDACCDPLGRLWAGTATSGPEARGALYRIAGERCDLMVPGIVMSNGIGWSPDARALYYSDSAMHRVYAFDFDLEAGTVSSQRTLHAFGGDEMPDGLAVDTAGCIWIAVWGGSAVLRLSPSGDVLSHVALPTPHVTSCAFGGPDFGTLFITTARSDPPFADDGIGGALFSVRPGARGAPPAPYTHA
jgi:sugar lactone lactonase YvrE